MTEADRLDRIEAHLDQHQQRLDDHEQALASVRASLDSDSEVSGLDTPAGGRLAAGGLLAALGLTAATGTVTADPQGQVGTDEAAAAAVHVAALGGPVTDGQRVDSLVGGGLAIEDGTLTLTGGN